MKYTEHGCPKCPHRLFGIAVCLLAAVCFALGIADVVYTYSVFCYTRSFDCSRLPFRLTWVGVGIWASVPIFVTGLFAVAGSKHSANKRKRTYLILCSISALIFTPALVVISAFEVWLGRDWFYSFPPSATTGSDVTKLSVPLTIAVLGAVLCVLIGAALVWECCDALPCIERHHEQQHQGVSGYNDNASRRPGRRKRSAVDNAVYVLDIAVVGNRAPRTPMINTQCEVHGVSRLCVNNNTPCQACMGRARRGVGNWSRASPVQRVSVISHHP